MPKVHNTRKERAVRLFRRLVDGPSLSEPFDGSAYTANQATVDYRRWSRSWIIGDLIDLVPELRKHKEELLAKVKSN
jgi:hypothetical protein